MEKFSFNSLNISQEVIKAVTEMGYENPTEIQEKSIPLILEGFDVIGRSHTGTGKTAAFGIPAVEAVDIHDNEGVQILVLCPTRELAMQSCEEIKKFSKYKPGIRAVPVYGGQQIEKQLFALKRGAHIVIGTPGRIMDHMRRKTLKLNNLKMVILDEADEMLNMGFRDDIETILKDIPEERQTILFSATMPPPIMAITRQYQKEPKLVEISSQGRTIDTIEQSYYDVPMGRKMDALKLLIQFHNPGLSIVFCNTKRMVDSLCEYLTNNGIKSEGLHGDMKQFSRTQVMDRFKARRVSILIATDVAARGIDVDDVDAVFNFDIPQNSEYYIHRIGRTGRAGKKGKAFTLTSGRKQMYEMMDIQREIKSKIPLQPVPTPQSIIDRKSSAFILSIKDIIDNDTAGEYASLVAGLTEDGYAPEAVAAAVIGMILDKEKPDVKEIGSTGLAAPSDRRNRSGMAKLVISVGRSQGMAPNFIVGAVVERTELVGKQIGKIEIYDEYTTVEVPDEHKDTAQAGLDGCKINGKKVAVKLSDEKPRSGGYSSGGYGGRSGGSSYGKPRGGSGYGSRSGGSGSGYSGHNRSFSGSSSYGDKKKSFDKTDK